MDTQHIWFLCCWELLIFIFCALVTDHSLKCHFNLRKESKLPNSTTYTWIVTFFLFIEFPLICFVVWKMFVLGVKSLIFSIYRRGKSTWSSLSHISEQLIEIQLLPVLLLFFLLWPRTDLVWLDIIASVQKGSISENLQCKEELAPIPLGILRNSSSVLSFSSAFSLTSQFLLNSI